MVLIGSVVGEFATGVNKSAARSLRCRILSLPLRTVALAVLAAACNRAPAGFAEATTAGFAAASTIGVATPSAALALNLPNGLPVAVPLPFTVPGAVPVPVVGPVPDTTAAPATAASPEATAAPAPTTAPATVAPTAAPATARPRTSAPTKRPPATAEPATAAPEPAPETAAGPEFLCCLSCADGDGRCPRWLPTQGRTIEEARANAEFTFVTKGIILMCAEKTARCRERRRRTPSAE